MDSHRGRAQFVAETTDSLQLTAIARLVWFADGRCAQVRLRALETYRADSISHREDAKSAKGTVDE
jgi:hypothetical protein